MKRSISKGLSLPAVLGIGVVSLFASIILMSFLLALISSFTADPTALTEILSLAALLLAAVLFGSVFPRTVGGTALNTFICALISVGILLTAGLIMRGGMLSVSVFLNYFAFLGVIALTANISLRLHGRKRHRRY